MRFAAVAIALLAAPAPALGQQGTPLFSDDSLLEVTIQGPLGEISDNRADERGRPGILTVGGRQLPIALAPRGITRRSADICQFPPLRVDFTTPPPSDSIFAGQRRLKLVTHCRRNEGHQQHLLLEYAAYRMFNLLTPLSFRARLARIEYRDSNGRPMPARFGFFLEDIDDVGRRNGMRRMQAGDRIPTSSLAPREAARAALFEYMIGNLDWSMRAGPPGEGCCHNFRLLAAPGSTAAIPVPYDFDYAGLVDAPYAVAPNGFGTSSVRVRRYRGYCIHNAQALAAAREMRARQAELTAALGAVPGMAPRTAQKAAAYLQPFFAQIADDRTVQDKMLRDCVR